MMKFVDALRQEDQVTENGMTTSSTSLNACVDLFFNIGSMRGQDKQRLVSNFSKAFNEDSSRALKILFWARDVRGGAGERQVFKDILVYLANQHTEALVKVVQFIPEFGRWDDLLVLFGTPVEAEALRVIETALLEDKNSLCAKWMPRKGVNAEKLRKHLQMPPKQYRKTLVEMTKVVETQMCAGEWEKIEFGKLPSVASSRYQKAFGRRTPETYGAYIESLQKGEEKINAGAVYPYDIVKSLQLGNVDVATEQWKALPNWMEHNGDEMILPVVDVSGSMTTPAGNNPNVTCMMVAISLGLYISERNEGPFKDAFITFHEKPELQVLRGSLNDRYTQLKHADWGMNTNLESVFKLVLNQATKHKLSEAQMPTKILILSDMEFDAAVDVDSDDEWGPTAHQMIQQMYQNAGYKIPQIVFWNLQSRNGGVPVAFDKEGTALISGFSPAIMKSVIGGDIESPEQIMDKTILTERYSQIC